MNTLNDKHDNKNYDKPLKGKDLIYTGLALVGFILLCAVMESIW